MNKKGNNAPLVQIIWLIAFVILVGLACGGSTSTGEPKISTSTSPENPPTQLVQSPATEVSEIPSPPPPVPTDTPLPTNTPVPEMFLGDAVEKNGYALTPLSVEDPAKPGMFYQPEAGKKLVGIEIVVSNISGDPISVNPLNAILLDTEGFTYQLDLVGVDSQLSTVDLYQGEKVRGWVGFKVPDTAKPASIKYTLDLFGSDALQASLIPPPDGHAAVKESPSTLPDKPLPKLGDTVEQFGYSFSATDIQDPADPGILYSPKNGYKLVGIQIILGNVSGDPLSVNPLNAYLVDEKGFIYTAELAGMDDQINTIDLAIGEKAKGWVAFSIPENVAPVSIKYQTKPLGNTYLQTGLTK